MNTEKKEEQPLQQPLVVRSCRLCKWASEQYQLTKEGYYPKTAVYIQCNVPISEELRAILPESFYRESATKIGVVHPDSGDILHTAAGEECPSFDAA